MSFVHISFEVSFDIIGHPLCEFGNCPSTNAIHIYESLMVEAIDERECVPEQIAHFELELIVIFVSKTLTNLLYFILSSIDVVFQR